MPAVGGGPVPRWYKEICLGTAVAAPGVIEGLLAVGIPAPSTDPVLSAALALVFGAPGIALLVHGVRLGRRARWKDTRRA